MSEDLDGAWSGGNRRGDGSWQWILLDGSLKHLQSGGRNIGPWFIWDWQVAQVIPHPLSVPSTVGEVRDVFRQTPERLFLWRTIILVVGRRKVCRVHETGYHKKDSCQSLSFLNRGLTYRLTTDKQPALRSGHKVHKYTPCLLVLWKEAGHKFASGCSGSMVTEGHVIPGGYESKTGWLAPLEMPTCTAAEP